MVQRLEVKPGQEVREGDENMLDRTVLRVSVSWCRFVLVVILWLRTTGIGRRKLSSVTAGKILLACME